MRVIKLEVSNYLGIKAVCIKPDCNVIRIEGRNGAGKSSVIGAIWVALGGKDSMPDHPVNYDSTDARIVVDLGEIVVTRRFTEKSSYLEVVNREGLKFPRPQETLNKLFSLVSFDPQVFIDMKPKDRREYLLELTGQKDKLEELEQKRKEFYDKRTFVNKEVSILQGKIAGAPEYEDVEEKSSSALMTKLEEVQKKDAALKEFKKDVCVLKDVIREDESRVLQIKNEIVELEKEAYNREERIARYTTDSVVLNKKIESYPPSEVPAIRAEIESLDSFNQHVRAIKEAQKLRAELQEKSLVASEHTEQIRRIDESKLALLSSSALPIPTLSVDDKQIIIDGVPFDDLSYSEQIKISMSIGVTTNPKLRVLKISHGKELDSESMAEVEKFAETNDCQVWIECVTDESQGGIFIEDGSIKE